jgi:hypothetical protein
MNLKLVLRVPRAGLAESTLELLRAAVADEDTVARFRTKIRVVPGSPCRWWSHAVSGRGHGRFWLGTVGGRDVVVIAHRFAWALEFGVDALQQVPVLGHRCDNPLCQRIGPGHVEASTAWRNRQEWVMRRDTIGGALRDARGARGRARALRDAVRRDPTSVSLAAAMGVGMGADAAQVPLWELGTLDGDVEQGGLPELPVGPEDLGAASPGARRVAIGGRGEAEAMPPVVQLVVERAVVAGQDHRRASGL